MESKSLIFVPQMQKNGDKILCPFYHNPIWIASVISEIVYEITTPNPSYTGSQLDSVYTNMELVVFAIKKHKWLLTTRKVAHLSFTIC